MSDRVDSPQCPRCGRSDRVQKVSGVFSAGTQSSIHSGPTVGVAAPVGSGRPAIVAGSTVLRGFQQTALSGMLAPPSQPAYKSVTIMAVIAGLIWFAIWLCLIAPLSFGTLTGTDWSRVEGGMVVATTLFVIGLLSLLAPIVALAVWASSANSKRKRNFERDMSVWRTAMERWQQLYYCEIDDCVFLPGTALCASASQMSALLYE